MASEKTPSQPLTKAEERAAKAAEARAAKAKREQKRRILTIGGVVLAMVLIVGGGFALSKLTQEKQQGDVEAAVPAAGEGEYGVTIGDDDAPHEIVIYEDFLCPFCGALERGTSEDLTRLAADGKVQIEYRPFDLLSRIDDYPIRATNAFAVVLEEEGDEVAKEFHDLLYANQPEEGGPYPSDDDLVALAVEAGADEAKVRPGIEDLTMEDWVTGATDDAQEAGIDSTPTILVDGEIFQQGGSIDELAANLVKAVE